MGSIYDPYIYPSKAVAMQRILDFLGRGFPYHTEGVVPTEKASGFADKFAERYGVNKTKDSRRHARKRGEGVAILVMQPHEQRDAFYYWLLVSGNSEHPASDEEDLRHYLGKRSDRLKWGDEFEVVIRTRPSERGGGTFLTWQMQAERFEQLQEAVTAAARQEGPRQAYGVLHTIERLPGFGGIRDQAYQLLNQFKQDWSRHHRRQDHPQLPRVPYIDRKGNGEMVRLSEVVS